tara:strand:- start:72 stop:371 length:300 start_codon:yes stop_codon:yes gene_type:complete
MASRLPGRPQQRPLSGTTLQLPLAVVILQLGRQAFQPLAGPIPIASCSTLQTQLLLQQLNGKSPGLISRCLIQGRFQQVISPLQSLGCQPFGSPAQLTG